MTAALLASLVLSAVCGLAVAGLFLAWPRRLSAEEWVLQRRAAALSSQPTVGATTIRRGGRTTPAGWHWRGRRQALLNLVEKDLALLGLARVQTTSVEGVPSHLLRLLGAGAAGGLGLGLALWLLTDRSGLPIAVVPLSLAGGAFLPAAWWITVRHRATQLRTAVQHRLPRVLTGTRMLLESGAATPEAALAMAVSIYQDPAADLLREALRIKEVRRRDLEAALDEVADRYSVDPLHRLADAFRVGSRYGTRMGKLLADFSMALRQGWHADYRERITRAPVLMTIPALIFFVAPLLVLILFLVFSPLMRTLSQV
jgi:Flp pilus assembly protein TadB